MEELNKNSNRKHQRIIPQIIFYLKNKNKPEIFKKSKSALFATGGRGIYLFSNSLEHMGCLGIFGSAISCLQSLSGRKLASGLYDNTIQIWNIKNKSLICTLSKHRDIIRALCEPRAGTLVSGSEDTSLIVWNLRRIRTPPIILIGHISCIVGIIGLNSKEIISGEKRGDLLIWNIDYGGTCVRHILTYSGQGILQMLNVGHREGGVNTLVCAIEDNNRLAIWDIRERMIEAPIQEIAYGHQEGNGISSKIEFISRYIYVRGGEGGVKSNLGVCYLHKGQYELGEIHSTAVIIHQLHLGNIAAMLGVGRNILVTLGNINVKLIDVMSKIVYLNFTDWRSAFTAVAKLY